jgi:hypothetical protein
VIHGLVSSPENLLTQGKSGMEYRCGATDGTMSTDGHERRARHPALTIRVGPDTTGAGPLRDLGLDTRAVNSETGLSANSQLNNVKKAALTNHPRSVRVPG